MALERIVLNIIPAGEMPVFHCSQYENGRPVIIDLVSSDDDAFVVPEGASVELHCRKVDDNIVTLEPDEVNNNTVTFVSTEQLTACPGDNLCEIVLYADTDPVQTIATLNFILHVEPDPLEGGLTSETQIYNLTEQIEEITQQVIGDDYYNKTEVDGLLAGKADQATTYTKSEVDTALNLKADKATTYTKTQVDSALALKADASNVYTKSQTDTLLNAKANTADLATVATTGDYDDLLNKPVIPAAQVQSDWDEEDNTDPSYIKNKPDIEDMIADSLFAVMPVGSVGPSAIANFETELAAPLQSVIVDVVATQPSGTPTPSTPLPITGYSSANITRCGVNLWDEQWELGTISTSTGENAPSTTQIRSANYIPIKPSTTYYNKGYAITVYRYDINKAFIGYSTVQVGTFTTDAQTCYIRFWITATTYNNDISINYPATDTTYHAYNGDTYAIAFGQTVYGGVLDVTRGKLTVTHGKYTLDNTATAGQFDINTYADRNRISYVPYQSDGKTNGTFKADKLETAPNASGGIGTGDYQIFGSTTAPRMWITVPTTIATAADFLTYISSNPIEVVYELDTPFDIDLTPEVISAIVGENNMYSDTGDTTVQYKDSIQHYIDQRT